MGPDLMTVFRAQAERFGAEMRDQDVTSVDFSQHPLKVESEGEEFEADAVIIATGAEAKWLGVPGEEIYRGQGVSSCATCDGFFFRGKRMVVVGGGDTAMEEALYLSRLGSRVTVVHRRDKLRASKTMQERAFANEKINFIWNSVIEEVLGETNPENNRPRVVGLRLKNLETGEQTTLETDAIFVAIGHQPVTHLFQGQIPLDEAGYAITVDGEGTATTIPGVFVAGDVRDKRYRQAVTAAGDGCKAAIDAERWLEEQGVPVDHTGELYPGMLPGEVSAAH
jgi:thioredoxin reductase (NADPH)